jgi:cholesterol transport system auxiliary component
MRNLTRRTALLGSLSLLGGCSALSALGTATQPLDTYDLLPVSASRQGRRTAQTLLVARPQAPAALNSDRIMIKPDPAAITYLPAARWSDELPALVQSLLIRSISGSGRVAYVGRSDAGPVPDKALLARLDAFEVNTRAEASFDARIDLELTLVNDSDQRIVASRRFLRTTPVASDDITDIVKAFQTMLDEMLPEITDWVVATM